MGRGFTSLKISNKKNYFSGNYEPSNFAILWDCRLKGYSESLKL